jgi:hypothetical protein
MNWQNKIFPTNPKKDKKSKYTLLPDINNEKQNIGTTYRIVMPKTIFTVSGML